MDSRCFASASGDAHRRADRLRVEAHEPALRRSVKPCSVVIETGPGNMAGRERRQ